jgi:hypothetical protein
MLLMNFMDIVANQIYNGDISVRCTLCCFRETAYKCIAALPL